MLSAIDVPKSKSISIAFMALKSMVLGIFLCISFSQVDPNEECSDGLVQAVLVFKLFYILGALLDLFLLFYFLFTQAFNRMEYYIMFIFHVFFAGFTLIVCLVEAAMSNDCPAKSSFLGASLALTLIFVINAFLVMWCNLYFALKFANLGCNLVWTFFWLQNSCSNAFVSMIGAIHGFLSIVGLLIFVIFNFIGKKTSTARFWKQIFFLSIVLMIFCYVLAFLAEGSASTCDGSHLFVLAYQKFGLIEIISPILLLIFMNT